MRNLVTTILRSKSFRFLIVLILIAGLYFGNIYGFIPDDLPNWLFYSKPIWSWLELLILPSVIFSGFYLLRLGVQETTNQNFRARLGFDKKITEIKIKKDRELHQKTIEANQITAERTRFDDILNTYLGIIMGLINEKNLTSAPLDDPVRQSARMHTIIALSRMNNGQNQHIIEAIRSAGLVDRRDPIISLRDANFRRGNFREVNFSGIHMENVNMVEADLEITNLSFTFANGGNFRNAMMGGANIQLADFHEAKLWWADLQLSTILRTNLYRAHLTHAKLNEAKIIESYLVEANLEKADMESVILKGSILKRAIMKGANLKGANLRGANLEGADLRQANLSGAIMYKSNFQGANLSGANLSFANIIGANFEDAIMPDGLKFNPAANPNKFTKA